MAKVKMLKTGETDIDSTDIWRFCFHSDYPTLKIALSGSQTFTIAAGNNYGEHVVTHNLGYRPIYIANIGYSTRSYQVPSNLTPLYNNDYIWVPNESLYDSIINFYSVIENNTLTIGASTADGENVVSTQTYTAYWLILLDEF